MILDFGNRRRFESGAVRDICEGKGRCDLLPLDVISELYNMTDNDDARMVFRTLSRFVTTGDTKHLYGCLLFAFQKLFGAYEEMFIEVSKHFEEGNQKYPPDDDGKPNWQKGIPAHCYIDSAVRHYLKHLRGDTDERHDRAFIWNIMCCIWTCENKPEWNDYRKGAVEENDLP